MEWMSVQWSSLTNIPIVLWGKSSGRVTKMVSIEGRTPSLLTSTGLDWVDQDTGQ